MSIYNQTSLDNLLNNSLFTRDNTEGYTSSQLDRLNTILTTKLEPKLAKLNEDSSYTESDFQEDAQNYAEQILSNYDCEMDMSKEDLDDKLDQMADDASDFNQI